MNRRLVVRGWERRDGVEGERSGAGRGFQMDSPKALTMQYMVLFSHRTVQLPAGERGESHWTPGRARASEPSGSGQTLSTQLCSHQRSALPLLYSVLKGNSNQYAFKAMEQPTHISWNTALHSLDGSRVPQRRAGDSPSQGGKTYRRWSCPRSRSLLYAGLRRSSAWSHRSLKKNKLLLEESTWQLTFLSVLMCAVNHTADVQNENDSGVEHLVLAYWHRTTRLL